MCRPTNWVPPRIKIFIAHGSTPVPNVPGSGYSRGMSLKVKWLAFCIFGLVLIGAGFSIAGEAIILKSVGEPWFWMGTGGLVVLNTGVSFFGSGVVARTRMTKGTER